MAADPGPVHHVLRWSKRIAIGFAGGVVVAAGVVLAMPLVPGPGLALVLLGLGILSLEFERPRIWLIQLKAVARRASARVREKMRDRRSKGRPKG